MRNFIVTSEQWKRLKKSLTNEEYSELKNLEWSEFFHNFSRDIDVRYIDDAPTKESDILEDIYFEIYNQNE